ncbi:MAG: hypothetical protein SOW01_10370, partial [Mediterranea sp.]|nr:hypothetical protein [Mediterranea sp.]
MFVKISEQPSLYNDLEKKSVRELLEGINTEDQKVALAVKEAIPQIEKLVCWIIKPKTTEEEEEFRLTYIGGNTIMKTPELSVLEAQKEIQIFAERVQKMFSMVRELLGVTDDSAFNKLFSRIEKYE